MNFFSGIYNALKIKQVELKDRKEFKDMVERKAKPIRRAAYMQQMLKEVVKEGIEKARVDASARVPQKEKNVSDFGIKGIEDPYKFLGKNFQQPTKRRKKKDE